MYGIFYDEEKTRELSYDNLKTYLATKKPKNLLEYMLKKTNGIVFYNISFYGDAFKKGLINRDDIRRDLFDLVLQGNIFAIETGSINLSINGTDDFLSLYKYGGFTLEDIERIYAAVEENYKDYYYKLYERLRFEKKEEVEEFINVIKEYYNCNLYAKDNCY
jgi:hypothetical protein